MTINLNLTDGQTHQVALYLDDWDGANKRSEKVEVLDQSGNVLDTETVSNFSSGQYLVWAIKGAVQIRITNLVPSANAVVNGLFIS